jgi:hypothetical protein
MRAKHSIAIGLAALFGGVIILPSCSGDDTAAPPQGQAGTSTLASSGSNGIAGSGTSNAGSGNSGDNSGNAGSISASGGSGGSGGSNSTAGSSGAGGAPKTDASSGAGGASATEACPMLKDKMPWPAGQAAPCTKSCATVADGGNDGMKVCAKVAFDSMECQKAASCKTGCTSGDCAVCGACM